MSPEVTLFSAALGLQEPWQVIQVQFNAEAKELHLWLDFARGSVFPCPVCGRARKVYDTQDRSWRHLNFFEHRSYLHAAQPRVNCGECGILVADLPWARLGSGFTLLFEAFVFTLCRQMPPAAVARLVGEHDTRLWRVLEHYVEAAREQRDMTEVKRVGMDETSSKRGHHYVSVFADAERAEVLFVEEGKDAQTVTAFRKDLVEHGGDPKQVDAVSMDLSPAFVSGAAREFPTAQIVFDRFHVMKLVNDALDQIRRAEVKENAALKQSRYLWLKNPDNLQDAQKARLEELKRMNLATATAYQMKLNLQDLWDQPDRRSAEEHLNTWYEWVTRSNIGHPMKRAAQTVKAHASGILNYYETALTNALMEGINSLIQAAKAKSRGFRTTAYLKIMIYLVAGKLDFALPI